MSIRCANSRLTGSIKHKQSKAKLSVYSSRGREHAVGVIFLYLYIIKMAKRYCT
jgi:hypothetical protein